MYPTKYNAEAREAILGLEQVLRNLLEDDLLEEDCSVLTHYFAPGLYARELFIPAGTVIVGKIHKHAHVNTISTGTIMVRTEDGLEEYHGPVTFVSKPGTKRAVYALTDTIWTTYHPTEETDLEKIEDHVIAKSYNEYDRLSYEEVKGLIQ